MAVRFLPVPPDRDEPDVGSDRAGLAEVVDLRARLRQMSAGDGAPAQSPASSGPDLSWNEPAAPAGEADSFGGDPELPDSEPDSSAGEDGPSANDDGVRLLARKARSSGELRAELLRLGHGAGEVEDVIDEFERNLYLDDAGLARALTEKLRDSKRASRTQIRMKLRERKLPDAVIEAAVGELDSDEEYALLREAAEDRARKLAGLDRQTAERRLLGFLARRGWSGEPAMRAARAALEGEASGARPSVRFR